MFGSCIQFYTVIIHKKLVSVLYNYIFNFKINVFFILPTYALVCILLPTVVPYCWVGSHFAMLSTLVRWGTGLQWLCAPLFYHEVSCVYLILIVWFITDFSKCKLLYCIISIVSKCGVKFRLCNALMWDGVIHVIKQ